MSIYLYTERQREKGDRKSNYGKMLRGNLGEGYTRGFVLLLQHLRKSVNYINQNKNNKTMTRGRLCWRSDEPV